LCLLVYVIQDYRSQGIGQLLIEAAHWYAEQIQAKGLELSTAVENISAQRLYERNGFIRDQEFYHYYLET